MFSRIAFAASALLAISLGAPSLAAADEAGCRALDQRALPANVSVLPTRGGSIRAEYLVAAANAPAFCKVSGQLAPVDAAAPMINFQLNLPDTWNSKAIQYGGGGLNGMLVDAVGGLRDAPPGPTPLAQGYATFGTDAGHQNSRDKDLQSFAMNEEALLNHANQSYKKTHDAARGLIAAYYGRNPSRMYFIGGSEGGREALLAAQRYPADYDGIASTVPVLSWTGVNIAGYRQWQAMRDGGWMSAAKVALLHKATVETCDLRDGLADGVLTNYRGCDARTAVRALRCPDGSDAGDACLSEKQIALVETVRSPTPYGYAISNGETEMTAYPTGAEAQPGNYVPTVIPPQRPAPDDTARNVYAVGDVSYFMAQDPNFRAPLDPRQFEQRIKWVSQQMDMNDPDLSAYKARGGKLLMKSNGHDYLVPPESVWRYYDRVVERMGRPAAEEFIRLYVAPWTGHGGQGRYPDGSAVPDKIDLLSLLDAWVEKGTAPADVLTLTAYENGQAARSWPFCRYPYYPHYRGAGDQKLPASYTCAPLSGAR